MKLSFQSKLLSSMLLLLILSLLALSTLAHRLLNSEVNQAVQSEIHNTLRNAKTFANGWLAAKSDLVVSLSRELPTQRVEAEKF